MEELILVGSGGCMRELLWQIGEYNKKVPMWNVMGYIDVMEDFNFDGITVCPYLGDDSYLLKRTIRTNVVICIGDPDKRMQLALKYKANPKLVFPVIDLSNGGISPDAQLGEGCVVSKGVILSANVHIGKFVFANMNATICHDGVIEDGVTIGPGVNMAGNVAVGASTYLGIGSTIIQGLTIGKNVMVGAGATVVSNVEDNVVTVGVPAQVVKRVKE